MAEERDADENAKGVALAALILGILGVLKYSWGALNALMGLAYLVWLSFVPYPFG